MKKILVNFSDMSTKHPEPCLSCREQKVIYARGLCSSCYQKWRRVMKMIPSHRRAEAEQKLISGGKLLAADAGPKPESNPFVRDLAEFLTGSERMVEAEAQGHQGQQSEPAAGKKKRGRSRQTELGPKR